MTPSYRIVHINKELFQEMYMSWFVQPIKKKKMFKSTTSLTTISGFYLICVE